MTHEEVQKQQHLPSKIQHYVPEPDSPVTPVPKWGKISNCSAIYLDSSMYQSQEKQSPES